ncbi:MAG: ATP-binding cassette domain-containing protein [Saprospiraceae bacterium]|nr:ATP-binding cassette domain-containing protein [Saprospiraceae bacterium]
MEIIAGNLSKSYAGIDIIKKFSHHFERASITGIAGPNGSGKSTLLKMLCGYLTPGAGSIEYQKNGLFIARNDIFKYITLAAPYSSVIKDFTLLENWQLLNQFKGCREKLSYRELLDLLEWKNPGEKRLAQYSSGMVQKVNLLFAMVGQSDILVLDEPTSYLDTINKGWYHQMAQKYFTERTVIIASNEESDFSEAGKIIRL